MTCDLVALCFDAHDPVTLARFWGRLLGWHPLEGPGGAIDLVPTDGTAYRLRFVPSDRPKVGLNRIHLDLTSAYPEQQQETVDRALALGARHIDVGQRPEEGHVVLADPEDNELCVIPAGNGFLADTGTIGAINGDGSRAVGYFWSEALGWPLVWDQDEETAIQSPNGGSKMAWGGPPVAPKTGKGPAAPRHPAHRGRGPRGRGRAAHRARGHTGRHRSGRGGLDRARRPGRQRVLRPARVTP